MARKAKQGIHPLRMMEALDLLNGQIAMTLSAIGMAKTLASDDEATVDRLRMIIGRVVEEGEKLRAAAWPNEDGDE